MRIGLDVDGVLADFIKPYQQLHVMITGRDTFVAGDNVDPPVWDWPALRGYTKDETSLVWEHIKASKDFWRWMLPMNSNTTMLRNQYVDIVNAHDLYFITTRVGVNAKHQTEKWLGKWVCCFDTTTPTVLLAGYRQKGALAKGLGLDCYLDDNYGNCEDVVRESPTTRTYLLEHCYNVFGNQMKDGGWRTKQIIEERRVPTLEAFLRAEGLLT
jgi:hypothetical protein